MSAPYNENTWISKAYSGPGTPTPAATCGCDVCPHITCNLAKTGTHQQQPFNAVASNMRGKVCRQSVKPHPLCAFATPGMAASSEQPQLLAVARQHVVPVCCVGTGVMSLHANASGYNTRVCCCLFRPHRYKGHSPRCSRWHCAWHGDMQWR
jgi:hypothetical protein